MRGVLAKAKPVLQDNWLFSYADLKPYDTTDIEGQAFLATNIAYAVAGAAIAPHDPALGALVECASVASVGYHTAQLKIGGNPQNEIVQLAIVIDYIFAVPSVLWGAAYAAQLGEAVPLTALVLAAAAFANLIAGWFVDSPKGYMLVHGLWHVLGAAAGIELSRVLPLAG